MALGILKVMIEEKLYDINFVSKWTVGFESLQEHVKSFTLDDVERLTWVPKAQIRQAAKIFSEHKPMCLVVGNALERGIHAFQTVRAVYILEA